MAQNKEYQGSEDAGLGRAVVICHHVVGYRIRPKRYRSLGETFPFEQD